VAKADIGFSAKVEDVFRLRDKGTAVSCIIQKQGPLEIGDQLEYIINGTRHTAPVKGLDFLKTSCFSAESQGQVIILLPLDLPVVPVLGTVLTSV